MCGCRYFVFTKQVNKWIKVLYIPNIFRTFVAKLFVSNNIKINKLWQQQMEASR